LLRRFAPRNDGGKRGDAVDLTAKARARPARSVLRPRCSRFIDVRSFSKASKLAKSLPCNRCILFQSHRAANGSASSRAAVPRCGAFMAKICDVVPQQPKALERCGDLANSEFGCASGGQSGVGPTKFSTEEFPGDRVRRGADRGDPSPCAACLCRDSARGDPGGRLHCDCHRCGCDGVRSAILATVRCARDADFSRSFEPGLRGTPPRRFLLHARALRIRR